MSEPSTLAGYMDDYAQSADFFGAIVDLILEQVPELLHPQSVTTFARMRHEPQLGSILRAYQLAITRANWSLDGAGCRDEVVARIADDLGLQIKGAEDEPTGARRRGFTWDKHLRVAARLSNTFGHAPFAQQWTEENGQWRLHMVQERMPQTIAKINLNPDGTLRSVEQGAYTGQANPKARPIETGNHELIWYDREREGSNYFGQSLIRDAYSPWLIKTEMLRIHATSIRRFGMGIPEVQAPPGATAPQIAEAERYAQKITAGSKAGAGVPFGFITTWKGLTGTVPDALAFITYLDRQMTRTTLTSILDMATAEKGNRSLGETVMDLMVLAQQSEADRLAEDGTAQIVVPLVDANWGENEPAPRIEVGDVGADRELTAQDMNWLFQYGGLNPDDPLEEYIRQRYSLPAIDHKSRRLEITEAQPTDPNAPTSD